MLWLWMLALSAEVYLCRLSIAVGLYSQTHSTSSPTHGAGVIARRHLDQRELETSKLRLGCRDHGGVDEDVE